MPDEREEAFAREMRLIRRLSAPPERVWAALTDPELLPKWFGPEGYSCRTLQMDLRPDGQWIFDMIGPDGTVWPNRHRYRHWEPPRVLHYLMDDGDDSAPPMEVEVELHPSGGGTEIRHTVRFPTVAARHEAEGFGAAELGMQTLAKLNALLGGN